MPKTNSKMVRVIHSLSISTLNVSGLNYIKGSDE